jgi:16S rRNA (guanine527-N7)-methyltransferase
VNDEADDLVSILEESRSLGFLGPGPVSPQIDHAQAFLDSLAAQGRILDLGSGGGVPGLVLALALPESEFVLLDSNQRRCAFLQAAIERLNITDRTTVVTGRAEELARDPELRGSFDFVVSRSFGPPAVTAECAIGFMSGPGSVLLISEPPQSESDRWPEQGLQLLGLELGVRQTQEQATIQAFTMVGPCPEKYPRRVGIPTKRPVF